MCPHADPLLTDGRPAPTLEAEREPWRTTVDLKERQLLREDAAQHWYYRAKADALDRVVGKLPGTVLDVGAGAGFFSRHLLERGAGQAICVDPGYDSAWDEEHAGRPLLFRRHAPKQPSNLILMMDVLEHVDDDIGLAAEYIRAARPGTQLVATVPAFNWMWSAHDEFLEHRRRYTLPALQAVLRQAGLQVNGACYLYGLLLPIAAATRLPEHLIRCLGRSVRTASQMRPAGPLANILLLAACRLEARLPSNKVGGLTAMAWGTVP